VETWKQRAIVLARFLIAIIIIGPVAYGIYWLFSQVVGFGVPGAILAGSATIAATHVLQRQRDVEAAQRQRKIEAYTGFMRVIFIDVVSPFHREQSTGEPPSHDTAAITDKLLAVSAEIGLWAGNDVLKEYAAFMDNIIKTGSSNHKSSSFDDMGNMLLAFRKDLGYRNSKVTARHLYPLFGIPCPPEEGGSNSQTSSHDLPEASQSKAH
jgi:hypothetical protein